MSNNTRVFLFCCAVVIGSSNYAHANPFVINEIVNNPQQDWNDAATPFDPTPGVGAATESDEYIELKNVTGNVQSLEDYYLEMFDGTPVYDCFGFSVITPPGPCTTAEVYLVYDNTGTLSGTLTAVPAGGYVVIGNPAGNMISTVTLSLVDPGDVTVDTATTPYGSNWAGDESGSRFPDGVDTDDDENDFAPLTGSPGSSNGALCALGVGDVVVNEIVSDPEQDWDNDGGGTPFDGTAGVGSATVADEYVELKNTSGASIDLTDCVLDLIDTTREKFVFSANDAPTDPYVRVFDSAGSQVGTANMIAAVPTGGYVLVGDPPVALNLANITVAVLATVGAIDTATVSASAGYLGDESVSRFPDGVDTDTDFDDFSKLAATPGQSNGQLCALAFGDSVINEVVTDPQRDWNDDTGVGTPFDGTAGPGTNTSADEFVEIKNTSGAIADLTGCVLTIVDGTDTKLVLQPIDPPADPYLRVFDAAGALVGNAAEIDTVPAGGYVLIGDPPGAINNVSTLTLLSNIGTLDVISVNANAAGLLDEAAARFPDGTDTGVDVDDLTKLRATPGASNGDACPLSIGDAVINEVVTDPQSDWDHDNAGTAFDGTAMNGTVTANDEYIELKNTSGGVADFEGCTVIMADTSSQELVLQTLDANAAPYVRVFDDAGAMVGTATSLDVVPIGGYVLIGNPPGTLNNDIVVSLLAAVEIDNVDFGADAPSLNASNVEDESGARLPDGSDTDVGLTDFKQQRGTPGASNEIDECTLLLDTCAVLATCTDTAAGFDCTCIAGYMGSGMTCIDIDECTDMLDNCHADAMCTNTAGTFTCACNAGFTGDGITCTDDDECATGDDDCDVNAMCMNTAGSFDCTCDAGWQGDGTTCTDINECTDGTNDCDTDALCTNTDASFTCTCNEGFTGDGTTCTSLNDGESGGCGCSTGAGSNPSSLWLLVLIGLALTRRRRKG